MLLENDRVSLSAFEMDNLHMKYLCAESRLRDEKIPFPWSGVVAASSRNTGLERHEGKTTSTRGTG
jgi:hypothetical protein